MLLRPTVLTLMYATWLHFRTGRRKFRTAAKVVQAGWFATGSRRVAVGVLRGALADPGDGRPVSGVVGGRSNLEALTGKTCGMAEDVLVEQDPNAGVLIPIGVPVGEGLGTTVPDGFRPNGIPADVSADPVMEPPGGAASSMATAS